MYQVGVAIYIDGRGRCRMSAVSTSVPLRIRSDSIGPTLSLRDSTVRVIPDSFSVGETEKSNIGSYTIYKVQFKVQTETPQGHPIIKECEYWKRFSDFQQLSKQLHFISSQDKLPLLVRANYFDRFKETVIEERRHSAEEFLQIASQQLHLYSSAPFYSFMKGAAVIKILPASELITTPVQELMNNPGPPPIILPGDSPPEGPTVLEEIEEGDVTMATNIIRAESVIVSEWGLEHNLKLREEEIDMSPSTIESDDLPLPSTPKTPEVSLIRNTENILGGSDWWSNALAQSDVLSSEDYDCLIDDTITCDGKKDKIQSVGRGSPKARSTSPIVPSNGSYVIQAGQLITQGLDSEEDGLLEESFTLFKQGVDVLLNGVQTDCNIGRRDAVRLKTSEYLQYAEILQRKLVKRKQKIELNRHENNVKPHLLQDFKITNIIASKVQLVESKHNNQQFVFKVLYKQVLVRDKPQLRGRLPRSKNRTPSQCPYMVKLLHHYETQSNRIFLLLEHVKNGRLIDHIQSIRHHQLRQPKRKRRNKEEISFDRVVIGQETSSSSTNASPTDANHTDANPTNANPTDANPSNASHTDEQESYIEHLLEQLTTITPPTIIPMTSSIGGSEHTEVQSEEGSEDDLLDRLRRQVEELDTSQSRENEEGEETTSDNEMMKLLESNMKEDEEQLIDLEKQLIAFTSSSLQDDRESRTSSTDNLLTDSCMSINIVPPTPTTPTSKALLIPSTDGIKKSSTHSTPQFSPVVSLRGSPEVPSASSDWQVQLEYDLKKWTAQIVIALEHLHTNGIICKDLQPDNILLTESGDIRITYFGEWDYVNCPIKMESMMKLYVAPELQGLADVTASADWWSVGAILFECITGKLLVECHPGGIHSHIPIIIPGIVSPEAKSFLQQLLQVSPLERIGSGLNGIDEIKSHPFLSTIDWRKLY